MHRSEAESVAMLPPNKWVLISLWNNILYGGGCVFVYVCVKAFKHGNIRLKNTMVEQKGSTLKGSSYNKYEVKKIWVNRAQILAFHSDLG